MDAVEYLLEYARMRADKRSIDDAVKMVAEVEEWSAAHPVPRCSCCGEKIFDTVWRARGRTYTCCSAECLAGLLLDVIETPVAAYVEEGLTLEDHAELLDLCEQLNYDPEKIGIAVLQHCGFSVRAAMLSGDIAVYDADGKFLNYIDSGATVD